MTQPPAPQRRRRRKLSLTIEADHRVEELTKTFAENLTEIARRMASSRAAETVLASYVDEAHVALQRCGLGKMPPWYKRKDFELTCGPLLIGASVSFLSISYVVAAVVVFILGTGIAMHGWMRRD